MISVILPTFNSQDTISNTIFSVINQKYQLWELIIVDDGSEDDTLSIINSFVERDKRIRIIHSQHGGASRARNIGLDNANGKYIAFIDSDDRFDEHFLENGIKQIKKENADVAVFDFFRIKRNQKYIERVGTGIFNNYSACWNKLYRSKLWKDIRFPEHMIIEDMETVIPVVARAKKITKVNNTYYYYIDRDDSITNSPSIKSEFQVKKAIEILNKNLLTFKINYSFKEYAKFINTFVYWHLISGIHSSRNRVEKIKIASFISSCFVEYKHKLIFEGSYKSNLKKRTIVFLVKLHVFSMI